MKNALRKIMKRKPPLPDGTNSKLKQKYGCIFQHVQLLPSLKCSG